MHQEVTVITCPQGHAFATQGFQAGWPVSCPYCDMLVIFPEETATGETQAYPDRFADLANYTDDSPPTLRIWGPLAPVYAGLGLFQAKLTDTVILVSLFLILAGVVIASAFLDVDAKSGHDGFFDRLQDRKVADRVESFMRTSREVYFWIGLSLACASFIGTIKCGNVPNGFTGVGYITATGLCEGLALIARLLASIQGPANKEGLASIGIVVGMLSWGSFVLFLHHLGNFLKRPDLARSGLYLFFGGLALFVGFLGGSVTLGFGMIGLVKAVEWQSLFLVIIGGGCLLSVVLGVFVWFVKYARLLSAIRHTIWDRLAPVVANPDELPMVEDDVV